MTESTWRRKRWAYWNNEWLSWKTIRNGGTCDSTIWLKTKTVSPSCQSTRPNSLDVDSVHLLGQPRKDATRPQGIILQFGARTETLYGKLQKSPPYFKTTSYVFPKTCPQRSESEGCSCGRWWLRRENKRRLPTSLEVESLPMGLNYRDMYSPDNTILGSVGRPSLTKTESNFLADFSPSSLLLRPTFSLTFLQALSCFVQLSVYLFVFLLRSLYAYGVW